MNKKVLIVSTFAPSLILFRKDLLNVFLHYGYSVHVVAPNYDKETESALSDLNVKMHIIAIDRNGFNPLKDLRTMINLNRLFRCEKPDFVMSYTIKPVIYSGLALLFNKRINYTALITGLGFLFEPKVSRKGRFFSHIAFSLYKAALRRADCTIFQNQDDRSDLRKEGILSTSAKSGVVNGSGVCLTTFAYATPKPALPKIKFLLIARLLKDKGIREYVETARIVRGSFPECEFHLAGWLDSNPSSITEEQLEEWKQQGNICFLGKLGDVRPAIEVCDVYVLPSYREGTPRTVLEAMAIGRPIITTDAPGCRETVIEGQNGFLVPVKEVGSLVGAMTRFIENPELVRSMGLASRKLAEEKYDAKRVAADMLALMGAERL